MSRELPQHPRPPVSAESYIYTAETETPVPPEYVTAIPDPRPDTAFWKAEAAAAAVLRGLIIFFGLALATLMFAQVLLRYVFNSPFVGIEEIALLFGVWSYFLGIVHVTRNGEHIHGGILALVVKNPQTIRKVRLAMSLIAIASVAVFAWYAISYALFEIEKGRLSSYMRWPRWLWSSSLIAAFAGMVFYLVLQVLAQAADLKRAARAPRSASQ